jgi:hypothetical protein
MIDLFYVIRFTIIKHEKNLMIIIKKKKKETENNNNNYADFDFSFTWSRQQD